MKHCKYKLSDTRVSDNLVLLTKISVKPYYLICIRTNQIYVSTKTGFSIAVILFRHNYFDVITYEKSTLYNTGDCLQLFFERRVDVVETGVEDKVAVFCKDRPVFAMSRAEGQSPRHPVVATRALHKSASPERPLPEWGICFPTD